MEKAIASAQFNTRRWCA